MPQLLLQSLLLARLGATSTDLGATSTDLGPLQLLLAVSLACSVASFVPRVARCCPTNPSPNPNPNPNPNPDPNPNLTLPQPLPQP